VIDAMARALGADYATVHRGVYARSANMTLAYEAARRRVAGFIGAQEDEIVFVRGATEGINLVAQSWGGANLQPGDRILLSQLEHHSNIVPWQMIAERMGAQIDVVPLTQDGRIDLEAMERIITPQHKMVALAHVSNVLGSTLDVRASDIAHSVGAVILIDGCQAVPRLAVDVRQIGCDFYVFSAHKLYGPTGIGALWGRKELLDAMPPYQGGGSMIDRVTFARTTYAPAPTRFEAGTPAITSKRSGLRGDRLCGGDRDPRAIHAHEVALVRQAREALSAINSVRLFGPEDSAGIVSFEVEGVHPHDVGTILDEKCRHPRRASLRAAADGASWVFPPPRGRALAFTATRVTSPHWCEESNE
jgi:cysteine desulfurase/selenocysteine lyase